MVLIIIVDEVARRATAAQLEQPRGSKEILTPLGDVGRCGKKTVSSAPGKMWIQKLYDFVEWILRYLGPSMLKATVLQFYLPGMVHCPELTNAIAIPYYCAD
jgi:hypothetical protein